MGKTYIVEHLDPELEQWSTLEYKTIAEECAQADSTFVLSSVPTSLKLPETLNGLQSLKIEHDSVETVFAAQKDRICLLDPAAKIDMSPQDANDFDIFLFGGILGDDPPRDRTSELRKKGYQGRRLGARQMTTDTAVRVTRMIMQEQIPFEKISFIDDPEIRVNAHESTEMPFRYVADAQGKPVMPAGMVDLIKKDSEKGLADLL